MIKGIVGELLDTGNVLIFDLRDGYTGICSIFMLLLIYCTLMFYAHLGVWVTYNRRFFKVHIRTTL